MVVMLGAVPVAGASPPSGRPACADRNAYLSRMNAPNGGDSRELGQEVLP